MDLYNLIISAKLSKGEGGDVEVDALNVTENGTYTASSGHAYSPVTVNVPNTYAAGDEGKVVSNGALVGQTSVTKTANGTYDTTLNDEVVVNVPSVTPTGNINITSTAQTDVSAYATAQVVDADLVAGNIKKDVDILGVIGTYEGGGGGDATIKALIERSSTAFEVPNGTTKIGDYAFARFRSLESITIPDTVQSIGYSAFRECTSLRDIEFPASISSIGDYVFFSDGINSLTLRNPTPPTCGSNAFKSTSYISHVYVPAASVDAYKSANVWSGLANIIQAIPE